MYSVVNDGELNNALRNDSSYGVQQEEENDGTSAHNCWQIVRSDREYAEMFRMHNLVCLELLYRKNNTATVKHKPQNIYFVLMHANVQYILSCHVSSIGYVSLRS